MSARRGGWVAQRCIDTHTQIPRAASAMEKGRKRRKSPQHWKLMQRKERGTYFGAVLVAATALKAADTPVKTATFELRLDLERPVCPMPRPP